MAVQLPRRRAKSLDGVCLEADSDEDSVYLQGDSDEGAASHPRLIRRVASLDSSRLQEPNIGDVTPVSRSKHRLADVYKLLKVTKQEIRVLEVKPGIPFDIVRCSIRHISLDHDDHPYYEAISYCWQRIPGEALIELDGRLVMTTASSEGALRRMRRRDRCRILWIDAICINQQDTEERSAQVGIMDEVYSQSMSTLVWLGDDLGVSCDRIECSLDSARHQMETAIKLQPELASLDSEKLIPAAMQARCTLVLDDPEALLALYGAPWFRRLWVVQEVYLARSSICFFGDHEHALASVVAVAQWLFWSLERFYRPDADELRDSSAILRPVALIFDILDTPGDVNMYVNVYNILSIAQELLCTDERDAVYALYGILKCLPGFGSNLPAVLRPDYSKTLKQVYRDFARHILTALKTDLFSGRYALPADCEEDLRFPSWVPLFHKPAYNLALLPYHPVARQDWSLLCHDDKCPADPDVLRLSGLSHASVVSISQVMSFPKSWKDLEQCCVVFEQAYSMMRIQFPAESETHALFGAASTLACDGVLSSEIGLLVGDASTLPAYFEAFRHHLAATRKSDQTPLSWLPPSVAPTSVEGSPEFDMAEDFAYTLFSYCDDKRFFNTSRGQPALGPSAAQPGDVVAILFGVNRPVLLRPMEGAYRLLGPCHVHGLAVDEAVDEHEAAGRSDEVFALT